MTISKNHAVIVVGNDTGLADYGWCVVQLFCTYEQVLAMGVISTKPHVASTFERGRLIARSLAREVRSMGSPRAATLEGPSPVRNGGANLKLGVAFGAFAGLAEMWNLGSRVLEVSPKDLKLRVTGDKGASKAQLALKLAARYHLHLEVPERVGRRTAVLALGKNLLAQVLPGKRHHAWDALGSVVACLDTDLFRELRPRY